METLSLARLLLLLIGAGGALCHLLSRKMGGIGGGRKKRMVCSRARLQLEQTAAGRREKERE